MIPFAGNKMLKLFSVRFRYHYCCVIVRPVARIWQQGGQKPEGGATFLKYSIGCMQQPVGPTWNGGTDFK